MAIQKVVVVIKLNICEIWLQPTNPQEQNYIIFTNICNLFKFVDDYLPVDMLITALTYCYTII